jgi:hypothetical protein
MTTTKPTDDNANFSYKLTESLLSHNNDQTSTPRLVTPLPNNAILFQQQPDNSSFNQYIGNQYKQDAPVFLDRLQVPGNNENSNTTFWSYLSKDLDDNNKHTTSIHSKQSTWYEHDSIYTTAAEPLIETSTTLFSMGALFFLFGFIFPPCWWIGSFYPKPKFDEKRKMDSRWRLVNRFFSLGFSTLLVIAIIVLTIVYSKTS